MKILLVFVLAISHIAFAGKGKFVEEYFVKDLSLLQIIKNHDALIVDHISDEGFELYGPEGTGLWLKNINASFTTESFHSHSHDKNLNDGSRYPSFKEIEAFLKEITQKHKKIAKLFSIGKSVEGRDLWVVKISDNVEIDEVEPEFKYISSMHGNEITGRELTQFLIKDLLEAYGKDKKITDLINNTEIFIMPSMNPDGSKRKRRANANGYDLNRNFPDWLRGDPNSDSSRQPETKHVMSFQGKRNFSLSANFHGGAVVVNYPWDNTYDRHPFDKLVQELSLEYANLNPAMRNSRSFEGGITNGADWYVLKGGMQDWSYFYHNDLQITVELSSSKWPRYSDIPSFYQDNKASMLRYAELIHQGAGIKLRNKTHTGKVKVFRIEQNGSKVSKGSYGFERGEFFKVLPKGKYEYQVTVNETNKKFSIEVSVDDIIQLNGNYKLL